MKAKNKSVSRAFVVLIFVISTPMVFSFQNCGKGFQAYDASSTLKSSQQTGTGANNGSGGSTGSAGTGNSGNNGGSAGNDGSGTYEPYPYPSPSPSPVASPSPSPTVPGPANSSSRFISLHQTAIKIATPPPAGSYEYGAELRTGFKQQYAPTGISGCAIGFSVGGCAFPGGGSLSLPEFTGYKLNAAEFKIYIPAGAKSLMLSGYAPQYSRSAFALRFGAEPARASALNDSEYAAAQSSERIDQSFANLINNRQELFVVHDGGGTLRFVAGGIDGSRTPITRGGWLYIRQLNGSPLYDIQGGIDVDMNKYAAAFQSIVWLSSGSNDPAD